MRSLPLLLTVLFFSLPWHSLAGTYYVKSEDPCPPAYNPCRTLSEYADTPPEDDNITMLFLEGMHQLSRNFSLTNVSSIFLDSAPGSSEKVTVNCSSVGNFLFASAESVLISNVKMVGCNGNDLTDIGILVIQNCDIVGLQGNSQGLEAFHVVAIPDFSVSNCTFVLNEATRNGSIGCSVFSVWDSNMNIAHSEFDQNCAQSINQGDYPLASTVCVFDSNLTVEGSTFTNNSANTGGVLYAERSSITVLQSTFSNNYVAYFGGVVYVSHGTHFRALDNCTFIENSCGVEGGVLYAYLNTSVDVADSLFHSSMAVHEAGVMWLSETKVNISWCSFFNNTAANGGALYATNGSEVSIVDSYFHSNGAIFTGTDLEYGDGAVVNSQEGSWVRISQSAFLQNRAVSGGAIYADESLIHVDMQTLFEENKATYGGACTLRRNTAFVINRDTMCDSSSTSVVNFTSNLAHFGGALNIIENSKAYIECTAFEHNRVEGDDVECRGGAILARTGADIILKDTSFIGNNATNRGGMLFAQFSSVRTLGNLDIQHNTGHQGVIYLASSTAEFSGNISFTYNHQSLYSHYSEITFGSESDSNFANQVVRRSSLNFTEESEGGALTALRSQVYVKGSLTVADNQAYNGGGMLLTESTLDVSGRLTCRNNSAWNDGGAIDAYQTDLKFRGHTNFMSNEAVRKGGAIFVERSTIESSSQDLSFTKNRARLGGAIYFDTASNFYIIKQAVECQNLSDIWYCIDHDNWLLIDFTGNFATEQGGAMYVNDELATSCSSTPETSVVFTDYAHYDCFIQSLAVYVSAYDWNITERDPNFRNLNFTRNVAGNGSVLYGGLLDRCMVNTYAEQYLVWKTKDPLKYFTSLSYSDFLENDITSDRVRICLCDENFEVNCSMPFDDISIQPGKPFRLMLAIVDQVGLPFTSGTINARLMSEGSRLGDSEQSEQIISGNCTVLEFSVFTLNQSEKLVLHPVGPCGDIIGLSRTEITLMVEENCPNGFVISNTSLECVCDPDLHDFVGDRCFAGLRMVERQGNAWIGKGERNLNDTSSDIDVIAHKFCPYDYCLRSQSVNVSLEDRSGSDSQCAFNRTDWLCGCCDRDNGYSLTLGGSECWKCEHNWWLLLTLAFAQAGILLVAVMMIFNLTLASGTISGLLLYANILIANRFVFFPPQEQSFLTVFVSWLGVNLGIATCYYDGLDGFGKIWLQIAFEAYLLLLVLVVILLGRSTKVANFFYRYNLYPVHTLATLIMLSFEKLSRKVYSLVAFTNLRYVDGSPFKRNVWLFDPCLDDELKKVILFVVAGFIILTALVFNFILLFNKPLIAKCHNVYFISFMEAFHAPFKPNHQYWVGLLLLIRNISYIACDVFNAGQNPSNSLHFIFTLLMGLLLMKFSFAGLPALGYIMKKIKRFFSHNSEIEDENVALERSGIVYKSPYLDLLETSLLVNLLMLTYFTLYLRSEGGVTTKQHFLFNTSSSLVFVTFVGILVYHTCTYTAVARLFRNGDGQGGATATSLPPGRQHVSSSRDEERMPLRASEGGYGSKSPTTTEVHI